MLLDLLTELVQSVDGPVYPEQRPEADQQEYAQQHQRLDGHRVWPPVLLEKNQRSSQRYCDTGCREGCCHQPQTSTFPLVEGFCWVEGFLS
jgi:hypothetical protein